VNIEYAANGFKIVLGARTCAEVRKLVLQTLKVLTFYFPHDRGASKYIRLAIVCHAGDYLDNKARTVEKGGGAEYWQKLS
jgi:hypothetical protein